MKTQIFNNRKQLFLLMFFTVFTVASSAQEAEKVIKKSYNVSEGFTLGIDNEYGETNIVNWDKNEVSVVITITAEANSQAKADKILDKIVVDIDESSSMVYFETEVGSINVSGKSSFQIRYDVKAPSYINAELEISYGSLFIQELAGHVSLDVKYSSLTADALLFNEQGKENILDLAYGEASIGYVSNLISDVKYSKLNIDKADMLVVDGAYSKYDLGSIKWLEFDSKYDKIRAEFVESSLLIDADYTPVEIDELGDAMEKVELDMTYGNFKAGLAGNSSFSIDAEVTYGSINIPDGEYNFEKDGSDQTVTGSIGSGAKGKFYADIKYGSLTLR